VASIGLAISNSCLKRKFQPARLRGLTRDGHFPHIRP
jgi:hypothetical protein